MDSRSLDKTLVKLAALCAAVVGLMVIDIIWTRSSQDFFQTARSAQAYADYLAETPLRSLGLRINLGLDNLFIVGYAGFFVLLAARLRERMDARILSVALSAMLVTAGLDAMENHHIMTVVHSIENGLPVSIGDGQFQMVASQIKFHASYLSVLLFSMGLVQLGRYGRLTAISLWCYIPLGVLISVVPVESAKLLVLARTIFFVFAFLLSIRAFAKPSESGQ